MVVAIEKSRRVWFPSVSKSAHGKILVKRVQRFIARRPDAAKNLTHPGVIEAERFMSV